MNKEEPDKNLEQLVHERLRGLPDVPAPAQLIPGVLGKIRAAQNPVWWRRPWLEWPLAIRIVSLALVIGALAGTWAIHAEIAAGLNGAARNLKPIWTIGEALLSAHRALVGSIAPQFLILGAALVVTIYLSAVGLGALCYRIATDRKLNL